MLFNINNETVFNNYSIMSLFNNKGLLSKVIEVPVAALSTTLWLSTAVSQPAIGWSR